MRLRVMLVVGGMLAALGLVMLAGGSGAGPGAVSAQRGCDPGGGGTGSVGDVRVEQFQLPPCPTTTAPPSTPSPPPALIIGTQPPTGGAPPVPPREPPVATSTPTPTATASPVQTASPTASPTPTPTPSPSPSPTPTPTPSPTASPSPTPPPATPTQPPTISDALQQQAAAQFQSATYQSGPQQLTVGQTTRINATYTVTNPLNEQLNYAATVVFGIGTDVSVAGTNASRGNVTASGSQVSWGGFALGPGESASITLALDVTPSPASAGRTVVLISDVTTTARSASGGFVRVSGPALETSSVVGLLTGGFVVTTAGISTTPGQPAPGAARTAAGSALPRVGAGPATADAGRWPWLAGLLSLFAIGAMPLAVLLRCRGG